MRIFPLQLISSNPQFDFIKMRKISIGLSLVLMLLSAISISMYKFNFGIDFIGGINIEIRPEQETDIGKMREILSDLEMGEVMIQSFGTEGDISIRVGVNSEAKLMENIALIKKTLTENFDYNIDYRKVDFVGPQVGAQMIRSGTIAMSLAFAAIMLYVWVRFEWRFGVGVLIALMHDVFLGLGFMSIGAYDFNLSSVAAILTIIGYSVNDSVVVYDRIRENLRKYTALPINAIINKSINETLSRTAMTSVTTLLANLALIILGGEAIRSFSLLVFIGILVGTYSSIFIAAPILTLFNVKKYKKEDHENFSE